MHLECLQLYHPAPPFIHRKLSIPPTEFKTRLYRNSLCRRLRGGRKAKLSSSAPPFPSSQGIGGELRPDVDIKELSAAGAASLCLCSRRLLEFNARGGLIEIHSATLKPPPPSHVRSMHFILHLSTWHSKPALPPKLLLLLNYNFVRSGSVQYRRQSEISLKDRAVSPPASITCTAAPNRQLISRGLFSQRLPSKDLEPDRKFPPKQFHVCSPCTSVRLSRVACRAGSSSVSRSLSAGTLQQPNATSDPRLFGAGALSTFIRRGAVQ